MVMLNCCSLLQNETVEAPKTDCLIYNDALPIYAKDAKEALVISNTSVSKRIEKANAIWEKRCT